VDRYTCVYVSEKHGDGEGVGSDNEECECGVGVSVNETVLFETLQVVGLIESVRTVIRFRKKNPINLCACDNDRL
jgi:hypothetical protein